MIKPIESPRLKEALDMLNEAMEEIGKSVLDEENGECVCELAVAEEKFYDYAGQMFAMLKEAEKSEHPLFEKCAASYAWALGDIIDKLV